MSRIVPPIEIPKIWVWTAPEATTAHTSLLIVVTAGATAVGGGDFTVDSDFVIVSFREVEFEILVLVLSLIFLFVDSVTIGPFA
jgi:hypothetical protein